jgi:hypothetical protein
MLSYGLANRSSLRVFYRTSTSPPSFSQLQDVVDNSNPLLLTSGNPNLKQAYSHTLMTLYSAVNIRGARNYSIMFSIGYTQDYIGNSTLIAQEDSLLSKGVRLTKGTQLTKPANLNGNWNARSFLTYGFPFDLVKSNLNLNTSLSYVRTPGLTNGVQNASNSCAVSQGLVVGSNVSEDVDFTLSYTANYKIVKNTLRPELSNNYFNHTGSFLIRLDLLAGSVAERSLEHFVRRSRGWIQSELCPLECRSRKEVLSEQLWGGTVERERYPAPEQERPPYSDRQLQGGHSEQRSRPLRYAHVHRHGQVTTPPARSFARTYRFPHVPRANLCAQRTGSCRDGDQDVPAGVLS